MPYTEADYAYFFGRTQEIATLGANLEIARLTLFYGPSGVGKTSVLRAGVLYQLQQRAQANLARGGRAGLIPVYFNRWQHEPLTALIRALQTATQPFIQSQNAAQGAEGQPAEPSSGQDFVALLATTSAHTGGDLLFVLDQFEEYFLYPDAVGPGNFADALVQAVNSADLRANFLLSLREDALTRLDHFKGRIPFLFDNRLSIKRLDRAATREAIKKPLTQFSRDRGVQVTVESSLVDQVLDQLSAGQAALVRRGTGASAAEGGRIETPYLQLVLTRLWAEEQRQARLCCVLRP